MERLDLKRARTLLTLVVAAEGADTTRTLCQYMDPDGKPDCIVGHVLAKVGLDLHTLGTTGLNHSGLGSGAVAEVILQGGLTLTPGARSYLTYAQQVQDGQIFDDRSWGRALAYAEGTVVHGGLCDDDDDDGEVNA